VLVTRSGQPGTQQSAGVYRTHAALWGPWREGWPLPLLSLGGAWSSFPARLAVRESSSWSNIPLYLVQRQGGLQGTRLRPMLYDILWRIVVCCRRAEMAASWCGGEAMLLRMCLRSKTVILTGTSRKSLGVPRGAFREGFAAPPAGCSYDFHRVGKVRKCRLMRRGP